MARSHGRVSDVKGGTYLGEEADDQYEGSLRRPSQAIRGLFRPSPFLSFDDKPKYSHLRKIFRCLLISKGFDYDHVYDWTILEYLRATQ